jgi:hypothetical protein
VNHCGTIRILTSGRHEEEQLWWSPREILRHGEHEGHEEKILKLRVLRGEKLLNKIRNGGRIEYG